ncbi:MAG: pyridoxamine 5'-phosphate oxidase family protein [Thermoplasmata archaeon]|nr:pyridoxamine 5'-phosphate oxidase family protein [Thermoplasmata archaeon]
MGLEVVPGSLSNRRVRASLIRLLRENVLASFASVGRRGRAHINTAYFAWTRDWSLFFYSYPDSAHCRNLRRHPSMAVAVFDSRQRWGHPDRGVQLFGSCHEADGRWGEVASVAYAKRFKGFEKWRGRLRSEAGTFPLRPYRFTPHRAKIFDERALGAGRFIEIEIP